MDDQEKLYNEYLKKLSSLPGVQTKSGQDERLAYSKFIGVAKNSLKVELYLRKLSRSASAFVGIDIAGVDTGFWHTGEFEELNSEVKLAEAALKGDVRRNTSKFLRRKEVCFLVDGSWVCCSTDGGTRWPRSSYVIPRKNLK